ncbi:hypothetical protein ACFFJB_14905 [Camelimonas abortus]|uniref:Tail fiber-like repeat protein n=1 Tax=Camelimonas abortus TaxID=1017184 RepID=A0ABV7LI86_9HYPH
MTLTKADVGLGNVDNTSDLAKPVSSATQAALNGKANASVTISAGTGLTGGGDLTSNRTISLDAASVASLAMADAAVRYDTDSQGLNSTQRTNALTNLGVTSTGRSVLTAASQSGARTAIEAQQSHANLTALSGVSAAADRLPYFNGASSMTYTTLSAFARTLLDDADAAAARTTLGAAPLPKSTIGTGIWLPFQSSAPGQPAILPAGGTYAYFLITYNASGVISGPVSAGIAAGGATVGVPMSNIYHSGLAWSIA